jgi:hypothetical protein
MQKRLDITPGNACPFRPGSDSGECFQLPAVHAKMISLFDAQSRERQSRRKTIVFDYN